MHFWSSSSVKRDIKFPLLAPKALTPRDSRIFETADNQNNRALSPMTLSANLSSSTRVLVVSVLLMRQPFVAAIRPRALSDAPRPVPRARPRLLPGTLPRSRRRPRPRAAVSEPVPDVEGTV